MKVAQIGDWALEDRLAAGGPPVIVMFMEAGKRAADVRRYEFRRVAADHPDARFYEVDVLENPSLIQRYTLAGTPIVLVFANGVEVARHVGSLIETTVDRVLGPESSGDKA